MNSARCILKTKWRMNKKPGQRWQFRKNYCHFVCIPTKDSAILTKDLALLVLSGLYYVVSDKHASADKAPFSGLLLFESKICNMYLAILFMPRPSIDQILLGLVENRRTGHNHICIYFGIFSTKVKCTYGVHKFKHSRQKNCSSYLILSH